MSHFAVAVIIKDINDLEGALAPYQENNMGDCPKQYLEFHSVSEEERETYETGTTDRVRMPDGRLLYTWDKVFHKKITKEEYDSRQLLCGYSSDEGYYTYDYSNGTKVDVSYKELYKTFEEYMEYFDYKLDEEMQDYGYWENPNAKWDCWSLCAFGEYARFKNEDMPAGYCKLKDYKKDLDKDEYNKAIRFWELYIEGQEPVNNEEKELLKWAFYKKEYYVERYGTKENYATVGATPHCYAFVLDGKWYEKGEMGWFACGSDTLDSEAVYLEKWKEVVNSPQYQDYYIAIVDCHI